VVLESRWEVSFLGVLVGGVASLSLSLLSLSALLSSAQEASSPVSEDLPGMWQMRVRMRLPGRSWKSESGLWVWVQVQLPLLPIVSACCGDYHGGEYRGVGKEIFVRVWLRYDEYRAVWGVIFC